VSAAGESEREREREKRMALARQRRQDGEKWKEDSGQGKIADVRDCRGRMRWLSEHWLPLQL